MVHKLNLPERSVSAGLLFAFVLATALVIWSGFFMRKMFFKKSADALPDSVGEALRYWKQAHTMGFAYAVSIALFGALLKSICGSWCVAGIFFGLSIGFLLLWAPRQLAENGAQPA